MAAGDLREERNERAEKKSRSPQGWEEGKSEGITFVNKLQAFNILCSC